MLTRESLASTKATRDIKTFRMPAPHPQHSPEPVEVRLRSFYGGEYLDLLSKLDDYTQLPGKLVELCWINEKGDRVLEPGDTELAWWKKLSSPFVTAIISTARKHCGVDLSIDVEEVGNSPAAEMSESST